MSRHGSDTWRPSGNNRSAYQNNNYRPRDHHHRPTYQNNNNNNNTYRPDNSSTNTRRPQKDWTTLNNISDDQIAPHCTPASLASLQRWALATANLPQRGHRSNEAQIIERIERRYGKATTRDDAEVSYRKREHSISPPGEQADVHDAKRRRTEVVDLTGDDEEEYAQSSEWSFPSSSQTEMKSGGEVGE